MEQKEYRTQRMFLFSAVFLGAMARIFWGMIAARFALGRHSVSHHMGGALYGTLDGRLSFHFWPRYFDMVLQRFLFDFSHT